MAYVLTNADIIACPHTPGAAMKITAAKLKVQGAAVLTGLGNVSGCTSIDTTSGQVQCIVVTISGGQATKLKVSGSAVLLSTLSATAAPPASPGGSVSRAPPPPAPPRKLNAV